MPRIRINNKPQQFVLTAQVINAHVHFSDSTKTKELHYERYAKNSVSLFCSIYILSKNQQILFKLPAVAIAILQLIQTITCDRLLQRVATLNAWPNLQNAEVSASENLNQGPISANFSKHYNIIKPPIT